MRLGRGKRQLEKGTEKGVFTQGEIGFESSFSVKTASKNSVIRQYDRVFVLCLSEKFLPQNCFASYAEDFVIQSEQKMREDPDGS